MKITTVICRIQFNCNWDYITISKLMINIILYLMVCMYDAFQINDAVEFKLNSRLVR